MLLSRYAFVTHGDETVFVTGLLRRSVFEINKSDWNRVENWLSSSTHHKPSDLSELINELEEAKVIVPAGFEELYYVVQRSLTARSLSDSFGLVIVPSMSCNMNCHYCFEEKSDETKLDDKTLEQLVKFTETQIDNARTKRLHVRWFGGEPLNDPNLVKTATSKLSDLCKKLGKSISGDLVTNGYNLTGELASKLSDLGLSSAQVTFEGEKRQHDKIRRVSKGGSYDRLIQNIVDASQHMEIRARIHVAPYNQEGIPNLLNHFSDLGLQDHLEYLYFAPLFNYDQSKKDSAFKSRSMLFLNSRDFSEQLVRLSRIAKKLGFRLADPLDTDYSVCTALREYTAVVNPDGGLARCYMDAGDKLETYGTLGDGVVNDANLSKWRNSMFSNDPECRECKFAPVCLGGCAKEVMNGADKSLICTPLKYKIDEVIPLHYSDAGLV